MNSQVVCLLDLQGIERLRLAKGGLTFFVGKLYSLERTIIYR